MYWSELCKESMVVYWGVLPSYSSEEPQVAVWVASSGVCVCPCEFPPTLQKKKKSQSGYTKFPLGVNVCMTRCVHGALQWIGISSRMYYQHINKHIHKPVCYYLASRLN